MKNDLISGDILYNNKSYFWKNKKAHEAPYCLWAHLESNQAPPDYESDALTE